MRPDYGVPGVKGSWRAHALWYRYRLTQADYDQLSEAQEGCCAICGDNPPVLVVDHCHVTGAIRGLLCSLCNSGIGKLKDDPDVLRRAANYLESSRIRDAVVVTVPLISRERRDYLVSIAIGMVA